MSNQYQSLIDYANNLTDYNQCNGIKIVEIRKDYAECRVDLTDDSFNPQGLVHGGLLFAICDVATGYAVSGDERRCVTSGASFNFLSKVSATQKYIRAVGIPIKVGKRTAVVEGSVYDDRDRLVAKGTFNYFFIDN
ncbi:MAG: PaaI family thioesterase [Clostridiales bacterium]|nr:PaaI family thioesterase [Clostridiales bacterium]